MKASEIINNFDDTINATDPSLMQKVQVMAAKAQMQILDLNSRAMACHCECLGMNAENCIALCKDSKVPYGKQEFNYIMQKWGLVDKTGKSSI